jgi:predicted DNA-binding WGR domain protein
MDNLFTLTLEAHSPEQNHHRRYQVTLGRDLLDHWTVAIRYGRVGQGGQEKRFGSPKAGDMQAVIRERLHRRLSAPRRIGCAYRLAAFSAAPGFDATGWLPGKVMAGFFQDLSIAPEGGLG